MSEETNNLFEEKEQKKMYEVTEGKVSVQLKRRFRKAKLVNGSETLSFRKFVRKLAAAGEDIAKAWLFNKSAQVNVEAKAARWKAKSAMILATRNASKLARKKSKSGGGGKSTPKAE